MTPQRLLEKAADYIEEHGLSRGGLVDSTGRGCVVHVLTTRVGLDEGDSCTAALALIQDYISDSRRGIGQWSDTTAPEVVVATLRQLATRTPHEGELVA